MRILNKRLVAGAIALAALGCSSGDDTDPPSLAGTWTATAIVATNKANAAQTANLYAAGFRLVLTLNSNNTFSQTITEPGQAGETESGTWSATATVLTLTTTSPAPTTVKTFAYTKSGTTFSFTIADADYDFGSGSVPASVLVTTSKN